MAAFEMSAAFERATTQMMRSFGVELVEDLASKYGFSSEEAIRSVGLEKMKAKKAEKKSNKSEWNTPSVVLPWTGTPLNNWTCRGLRLNHGLHSQCVLKAMEGGRYCKGCHRQADKNASGKPTYGTVEDRMECGLLEYRDPKDNKLTVPYANVMEKLGVSREQAEAAAQEFGLTIPEEHFVKRKGKRGRPVAVKTVTDSDGEEKPKKGRGRPKKEKKVIETSAGDDLIAALVEEAAKKKKKPAAKKAASPNASPKASPNASPKTSPKAPRKKKVLSEEEKLERKKVAAEKRRATMAAKKEAKKLADEKERMLKMQAEVAEAAEKASAKEKEDKAWSLGQKAFENMKADMVEELDEKGEAYRKARGSDLGEDDGSEIVDIVLGSDEEFDLDATVEVTDEMKAAMVGYGAETEDEMASADGIGPVKKGSAETYGVSTDEDEDEEVKVKLFEHKGKQYYRSPADNLLYDPATSECVGIWNEATEEIDDVVEFGSDEEDDE